MIDKYELIQVILVVTRYFGGTKLGTGGLIRAYGDCAESAIEEARIIKRLHFGKVKIAYPFDMINKVQHLVQKYGAKIHEDASAESMISNINVPQSQKNNFKSELNSATSGKVQFLPPD